MPVTREAEHLNLHRAAPRSQTHLPLSSEVLISQPMTTVVPLCLQILHGVCLRGRI